MKRGKMLIPNQFRYFYKDYRNEYFKLLDVGCGNHAARLAKKWFSNCEYYGVDRGSYNNDENDFALMKKFYEIDLQNNINKLDDIPDNYFNVIVFNHVIEHLENGVEVLGKLSSKLVKGGKIYIEFPSVNSLRLPGMQDTFNFCDDPTHIRIYSVREVANELLRNKFRIIKAGPRRNMRRIILTPLILFMDWRKTGRLVSYGLWDICGFAEYVYAEKL
ncbi:MAG: methyltransferase type 11 [Ignavibacteriae bacterium HGW-Ignavibacteriae-3]|nr:MAG: methyltransferase type 11 [Ignavibacteriae bacterium HGW-Ignavibacteriae-3]